MAADHPYQSDQESNELVAQLRQSLGLLRVAFDATEEAMLILDENHHVRWVNRPAAQWLGHGLALRVIGKPIQQVASFQHPDQRDLPYGDHQHPLSQAKLGDGQMLLSIQPLLVNHSFPALAMQRMVRWKPINEINEPYLLIAFRDLDPLEKALQQQRSFINKLAHELRTPLAIISGNLKRLSRSHSFGDALLRPLEDIRSETRRMVGLVDKLVVLSELDTDQFSWQFERHPLHTFVERWLHSLDHEKRRLVNISITDQCLTCEVDLDDSAFKKIMDSLLDNTRRFCEDNEYFNVRGSINGQNIELSVSDGGSTELANIQTSNLFDRFAKLEENRNPLLGDGSGLGLAVVKGFVEGMNGTVTASLENNQLADGNQGLKISMFFPIPKTIIADLHENIEDID